MGITSIKANPLQTSSSEKPRHIALNKFLSYGLASLLAVTIGASAQAGPREQAKRIHDLLIGSPPSTELIDAMATAIGTDEPPPMTKLIDAAKLALADPESRKIFYNVTVKNLATPWTNEEQTVFAPLNDYSATVIGMVLNGDNFKDVLSGYYIYTGGNAVTTSYSPNNNTHYEELENQNIDLSTALLATPQTKITQPVEVQFGAAAGVMTTRAAARAFFVDGTNRAMFRFTVLNHLCVDIEQLKDSTRPADRVRQDVSRSPGGDSRLFLNNCLACHAGMDPMTQAFANYEWAYKDINPDNPDVGRLVYTPGVVQEKYHINANNFKGGYDTKTDDWTNYWRRGGNVWLGWADNNPPHVVSGTGAKSMGAELANTDAFARCQVKKVFKAVCMRTPQDAPGRADTDAFSTMVTNFKSSNYQLKGVFAEAAAYCSAMTPN